MSIVKTQVTCKALTDARHLLGLLVAVALSQAGKFVEFD